MKANKKIMQKAVAWILAAMLLLSGQAVSVFAGESAAAGQSSGKSQTSGQSAAASEKEYMADERGTLKTYQAQDIDEDADSISNADSDIEENGVKATKKETTEKTRVKGSRTEKEELTPQENIKKSEKVQAILVLDEKSLLERGYDASELSKSFWAKTTQKRLLKKQERVAEQATDEVDDVTVNYYYTIGLCGIGITTEYGNLEELEQLDGVSEVILSPLYETPKADDTNTINGAAEAWENSGYTGKGSKVAVIDTGLDLTHQSFQGGSSFPTTDSSLTAKKISNVLSKLNASQKMSNLTAGQLYRSNKVPFAFNYIDSSLRVDHNDANGSDHGTHVAGIAAANKIDSTSICGVAPDAQIVVMKVFGNNGGAYFSDIMAAMEDAMMLGCDSVNISIGSAAGFSRDEQAIQQVFDRTCNTDIVVSIAAGNDYNAGYGNTTGTNANLTSNPDNGILASPGSYSSATTVASLNNAAEYFTVGEKNLTFTDSATSDATKFLKNFAAGKSLEFVPVGNYGASKDDFEKADVRGKIALVQRGGKITFTAKQENAQAAGAAGVIVYNNMDGTTSMKINDGAGYIPCISVSKAAGEYMVSQYEAGTKILTIGEGKSKDNLTMSSFSSWGCTPSLNLKPDLTAVGGNVLSTVNGGEYGVKSGTSMASPQIAGASAVVKQHLRDKFPKLSAGDVYQRTNQLLMSTATPYQEDSGAEYSPRKQGAGVVNLSNALASQAYLSVSKESSKRPKAELYDDPQKTGTFKYTFDVSNVTGDSLAYTLDTSVLTNGYRAEMEEDGSEYYLMSDSDRKVDAKVSYDSSDLGLYYDLTEDKKVDTRDIYRLMTKKDYSNREKAMADINKDDALCNGEDVQLFLDNLTGLNDDVDLDKEALIVSGNDTASVTVDLALSDSEKKELDKYYPNGIYVEGYTYLRSENYDNIGLSLPYMGFYGDWSKASVFDAQQYHSATDGRINSYGTYLWTEQSVLGVNPYIESEYEPEKGAISESNKLDVFESSLLRNVKQIDFTVTDDQDDEEYYYYRDNYITKAFYNSSSGTYRIYRSPQLWNGSNGASEDMLPNNTKTTLKVQATLDYKDKIQTLEYPITVDNESPELSGKPTAEKQGDKTILKASFKDNQYIAAVIFKSANGASEYGRFAVDQDEAGQPVKDMEFDVSDYGDDFMMIVVDYAMNQTDYDMDLGLSANGFKKPTALDKDKIYGFNMGDTANLKAGMVQANKKDASDAKNVASVNGIYAAEYIDGHMIAVNALKELSVYTPQGKVWAQSKIRDLDCEISDMAYNYADQKLYTVAYKNGGTYLCTMDIYDGSMTDIGKFSKKILTLGCTTEGQLYGLSKDGELCKIDKSSAKYEVVGKVSETESDDWVTLNYRQSMAYDHNTDTMYWYVFSYNSATKKMISRLDTIDLKTGKTKEVGKFDEACEVSGLFIPYDGSLKIEGTDQATGITLNQTSIAMFPGQENRIFAAVTPWNLNNSEIEWKSGNENVATVTNGRIKGVSAGDTKVTAAIKGTNLSAECSVKVMANSGDLYGYLLHDWHDSATNKVIRFNPAKPTKYKTQAEILKFVYAGEYVDGTYYCYDSNGYLYKVDPKSWTYRQVGKADSKIVEMAFDYTDNTMYGISSTGHSTNLVRINLNTGETTTLGSQNSKIVAMTCVPSDDFKTAKLYAINEDSKLVTLDKTSGKDTVDADSSKYNIPKVEYVQSMTYDYNSGYIYWAQVNQAQSSSLYVLDLKAKEMYYAGVIGNIGSQVAGLYTVPAKGKVPEIPYVELSDVNLAAEDCVMVKGTKMQMKAQTEPYNATSQTFTWKTDAKDIADVSQGGEVTAYNKGTANISVTVKDDKTGKTVTKSVKVKVTEPIENLGGFLMLDNEKQSMNAWIGIDPQDPNNYKVKSKSGNNVTIGAGAYYQGDLYAYESKTGASDKRSFYRIDAKSGRESEALGSVNTKVSDMTFDYKNGIMYAITGDKKISIVDLSSGALSEVYSQSDKVFVTLAADDKGTLYTIARDSGDKTGKAALYRIDLSAADSSGDSDTAGTVLTKIGDTGRNAVLEQSMTYDMENGYLYWAQISNSTDANLCIVDPQSGYASPIGTIGESGSEVSALYCDYSQEPEAPYIAAKDLTIKQGDSATLLAGGELQLTVSTDPVYATNKDFSYESSDTAVCEVSKGGKILAKKQGTAKITVSLKDKEKTLKKVIEVKVIKAPEKMEAFLYQDMLFDSVKNEFISFAPADRNGCESYDEGESFSFGIMAADRYDGSIYAYTNETKPRLLKIDEKTKKYSAVATVSDKMADLAFDRTQGIMYGLTYLGNKLVQVDLTTGENYELGVISDASGNKLQMQNIAADKKGVIYGITADGKLYIIGDDAKATYVADSGVSTRAAYESDLAYDESADMLYFAQCNTASDQRNLYVIDKKSGSAMKLYTIGEEGAQISYLYIPGESSVKVPDSVEPTAISLSSDSAKIEAGKSVKLSARVLPVSVSVDKDVTWSSSDEKIATVDDSGKVTGVAAGTALIKAMTKNGKVSASCEVTVREAGDAATLYGYVTASTGDTSLKGNWVSFSADDPSSLTKVAAGAEVACAANADGVVYAYLKGGRQLVKINFKGEHYKYENVGAAGANVIRTLAYDKKKNKLYGATALKLFEIDMTTGKQTALNSSMYFGLGSGNMLNSIAADQNGNVYGLMGLGALCTLDPTTGTGAFVIDKNAAVDGKPSTVANNSMCFDKNDILFWASSTSSSIGQNVLKTIDAKTGKLIERRGAIGDGKVKIVGIFAE